MTQPASHTTRQHDFHLGTDVVTRDGVTLGSVARVDGGAIEVDAASGGTFWLESSAIERAGVDRVVAAFAGSEIQRYRRPQPAPGTAQAAANDGIDPKGIDAEVRTETDESTPSFRRPGTGFHQGSPD
jgi:hypothetical protein